MSQRALVPQPSRCPEKIWKGRSEEERDEWYDALAGIEALIGNLGNEDVYSGATEVMSERGTKVMKAESEMETEGELDNEVEVEHPVQAEAGDEMEVEKIGKSNKEGETEQPIQNEAATAEVEINPTEQEVEVNTAAGVELNTTAEVEVIPAEGVEMNPTKARMEDVVVVTDGEDEVEKEPPREMVGQRVSGHEGGLTRSVVGATVRRRRLLIDEASEEEEVDAVFQPIGGPRSQRYPVSEENLVYRVRQFNLPTEDATSEREMERLERKRKGKQIAKPVKKKARHASSLAMVIQEPSPDARRTGRDEESDEEEALRWERRTKKRHEEARPHFKKTFIRMDRHLLSWMVKFKHP